MCYEREHIWTLYEHHMFAMKANEWSVLMMSDSVIRSTRSPFSLDTSPYECIWPHPPLSSITYSLQVSIFHTANVTFICN